MEWDYPLLGVYLSRSLCSYSLMILCSHICLSPLHAGWMCQESLMFDKYWARRRCFKAPVWSQASPSCLTDANTFLRCFVLYKGINLEFNMLLFLSDSPVMAATLRMKDPARRWHSLCLWVKAETEGPMEDRINTGASEGLMQRWGHYRETGAERKRRKWW